MREHARETGRRVLIALGGNAILKHKDSGTAGEQMNNVRQVCHLIARLVQDGYHLAITHGNGPQVGDILLKNEIAKNVLPPMPLDICGAESQGMIGYMLQQSLDNELRLLGIDRKIATILSQTVVDADDPAFSDPNKPIGPFYTAMEASTLKEERGWTLINDAGRGYRRVVPSPDPVEIIEGGMIRTLYEEGFLVVASGGGGVPVIQDRDTGTIRGVEAVIDKDRSAAVLARMIGAKIFLILTDVDNAYLNYERPDQRPLGRIPVAEAKTHLAAGHFLKGSMRPKIESAIRFLESGGEIAIVTSPRLAGKALAGEAGTIMVP
jgi:carbamate kinase